MISTMLPRVELICRPTPLHRLRDPELGAEVWIKRDDLTGFALGGNKGRKLEYLIAGALAQGAQAIVTCGSTQSNFIRQLAVACAMFGLECHAAVMDIPRSDYNPVPSDPGLIEHGANIGLSLYAGAHLTHYSDGTWDELYGFAEEIAGGLESRGMGVLRCPVGGSSPLGAYAFVQAGLELDAQAAEPFDWIVTASSSGSTQTGLQAHYHGSPTRVLGIASDPEPDLVDDFADLAAQLDPLLPTARKLRADDFLLNLDYVGGGYGVPSVAGNDAIRRLMSTDGILLDPIYSGKAYAGLLDLLAKGEIGGRVLFWHTGGTPSLFAMPQIATNGSGSA